MLLENNKAKKLLKESDRYDNTPLHVAAKKGFINVVRVHHDICVYSYSFNYVTLSSVSSDLLSMIVFVAIIRERSRN